MNPEQAWLATHNEAPAILIATCRRCGTDWDANGEGVFYDMGAGEWECYYQDDCFDRLLSWH